MTVTVIELTSDFLRWACSQLSGAAGVRRRVNHAWRAGRLFREPCGRDNKVTLNFLGILRMWRARTPRGVTGRGRVSFSHCAQEWGARPLFFFRGRDEYAYLSTAPACHPVAVRMSSFMRYTSLLQSEIMRGRILANLAHLSG